MANTYTLPGVLLTGTHAGRPAANTVANGTLYAETDTGQAYQSNGSAWSAWGAVSGGMSNPMTTVGDIIVGGTVTGGVAAPTRVAAGTATYVLTANGAGVAPSYQAPGGGGGALVLLEHQTASSSATLDFTATISSTYDDYQIEIVSLVPATATVSLFLQFSTDGGSTWIATGYVWQHRFIYGAVTEGTESSAAAVGISVGGGSIGAAMPGVYGTIRIHDPLAAGSTIKSVTMDTVRWTPAVSAIVHDFASGGYITCSPVNALRFVFSAGNIASGSIRTYGIAKI